MAIALVRQAEGVSATATTNPSFSVAPASGNLIVLCFASDDYNGTPNSGWTQSAEMEQQVYHGGYIWWRISDGSNPPGGYTIGSATVSAWVLTEWSGVNATPYDISEGQSVITSWDAYQTPGIIPSTGDRLLVAMIGGSRAADQGSATVTGWTNSFTPIADLGTSAGSTNDLIGVAYRTVTGNGSTSFSTEADYSYTQQSESGLIISFKAATAAVDNLPAANPLASQAATLGQPVCSHVVPVTANPLASQAAVLGTPALFTADVVAPVSDVTDGAWTDQAGGASLYAAIDEASASDADYIKVELASAANSTCEVKLASDVVDPFLSNGHFISYRYRKDPSAMLGGDLAISLVQGTTVIATWTHTDIGTSWTTVTQELTTGQADAITDYADLRLRFTATGA